MGKAQTAILVSMMLILSVLSGILYIEIKDEQTDLGAVKVDRDSSVEAEIIYEADSSNRDTIKIGLILALSGIKSDSDTGSLEGAELAIEKLNMEGGALGKEFELVLFDNRGTPIGSKKAAEKAIEEGVVGVVGPERSSYALAAAPVLQEGKVPMMTHMSTHTGVTKIGDYIFRACYTDEFQGKVLGKYAASEIDAERTVILRMIDEDYSWELSERFRESYESYGGKVKWIGDYKAKDMDHSDIIETVKRVDPDLVFIAGYAKDMGFIARQAEEVGLESQILTGDGVGSVIYSFGGEAVDGLKAASHWHSDIDTDENRAFLEMYEKKYGRKIRGDELTALSYDSVLLLGEAIKSGNSVSGDSIKENLFNMSGFEGVTGVYRFDKDGDPLGKELIMIEYSDGHRKLLKKYR